MKAAFLDSVNSMALKQSLALLDDVFKSYEGPNFQVRFWNHADWMVRRDQTPEFTLALHHPGALRRMLLPPNSLTMAESYITGDYDIDGNVGAVLPVGDHLASSLRNGATFRNLSRLAFMPAGRSNREQTLRKAHVKGRVHSVARDKQAIRHHYDVSREFYRLWLDERMIYSCAYFKHREQDLDTAQEQKLDLICRKLRLKPGERLLDIGCGWGGLVTYAAEHYGVDAVGITLSPDQANAGRNAIRSRGLEERCQIELADYREYREPEGFDKAVSVGMVEHVGEPHLETYFRSVFEQLRPGGTFLCHGIGTPVGQPMKQGDTFVRRYIFPDGELTSLPVTLNAAENQDFEVRDVESLREHYALTLRCWLERLEAQKHQAKRLVGESIYRTWRLFLAGSMAGFYSGRLTIYQTLLAKSASYPPRLPLTREDWYC